MSQQTIFWRGGRYDFIPGDTVATALARSGISNFGQHLTGLSSGPFCGIGQCQNCLVQIDGVGVSEACLTLCSDGLSVSPYGNLSHE